MNVRLFKFVMGICFVFVLSSFVSATNPSSINFTINESALPYINSSITINITNNATINDIFNFTNVTIWSGGTFFVNSSGNNSFNQTFVTFFPNVTLENKSSAVFSVFNVSILSTVTNGTYFQKLFFNKTNNQTMDTVDFWFNVIPRGVNQSATTTTSFNYSGSCELLNSVPVPLYNYTFNVSSLPVNVSKCFALYSYAGDDVAFTHTSRMSSNVSNLSYSVEGIQEFFIKASVLNMTVNSSSINFLETSILTGDVGKIITYSFTINNPSVLTVEQNDSLSDILTELCDLPEDPTIGQLKACLDSLGNETLPERVVEIINSTEYVDVPTSAEGFILYIAKLKEELQHQIDFLESNLDARNKEVSQLNVDKSGLSKEIQENQLKFERNISATQAYYIEKGKVIGKVLVGFVVLVILVAGFRKYQYIRDGESWGEI